MRETTTKNILSYRKQQHPTMGNTTSAPFEWDDEPGDDEPFFLPRSVVDCYDEDRDVDLDSYYKYRRWRKQKVDDDLDETLEAIILESEKKTACR